MAILSFWVIGLPVGWLRARFITLGPFGYWIGLIIGLAIGTALLYIRLHFVQKKAQKMQGIQNG